MSTFRDSTSICFWCSERLCCDNWVVTHRREEEIRSCVGCAISPAVAMIRDAAFIRDIKETRCGRKSGL